MNVNRPLPSLQHHTTACSVSWVRDGIRSIAEGARWKEDPGWVSRVRGPRFRLWVYLWLPRRSHIFTLSSGCLNCAMELTLYFRLLLGRLNKVRHVAVLGIQQMVLVRFLSPWLICSEHKANKVRTHHEFNVSWAGCTRLLGLRLTLVIFPVEKPSHRACHVAPGLQSNIGNHGLYWVAGCMWDLGNGHGW